jgi:type I site-specific restriction-modification system R (restriction) subunit
MSQSLASLLKARDSLSRSNTIPDQSLNDIENHLFREDQQFVSFIEEERELDGTSEMVNVHDSDISIPDSTHTILNKDQSETDSALRSDIVEIISPAISTEINSINVISLHEKLQSQERENVSLKLNAQKLLDHINSMEQKLTTVIAIESELASTVAQFDIMRSNFKREKEEQKVLTQKLSLELTCLKTTKEEGTTSNLIVEQRCHTLEAEKRDLLRQVFKRR